VGEPFVGELSTAEDFVQLSTVPDDQTAFLVGTVVFQQGDEVGVGEIVNAYLSPREILSGLFLAANRGEFGEQGGDERGYAPRYESPLKRLRAVREGFLSLFERVRVRIRTDRQA
jgi:hypothetical protein